MTPNMMCKLALAIGLTLSLTACDQARERLASFIAPESAEQALQSIDASVAAGRLNEAREKAVIFIEKGGTRQGDFEYIVARVAAMEGNTDLSLRYLSKAMKSIDLTPSQVMEDPAFARMMTDVRFLQVLTGQLNQINAPISPSSPSSVVTEVKASDDTKIQMTNQGTEVRAGDLVIKLPN